jgi:hypothetical protein
VTDRRVVSALTMLVLFALLAAGLWFGWRGLFSPLPTADEPAAEEAGCNDGLAPGDRVRTRDVTVSVYNAGSRSGLAGQTQGELTARGFIAGDIGNAPEDLSGVRYVRVLAPARNDPAARLVAIQFGENTLIQRTDEDLGPGVEVIVGDQFRGLVEAPRRIVAEAAGSGC